MEQKQQFSVDPNLIVVLKFFGFDASAASTLSLKQGLGIAKEGCHELL